MIAWHDTVSSFVLFYELRWINTINTQENFGHNTWTAWLSHFLQNNKTIPIWKSNSNEYNSVLSGFEIKKEIIKKKLDCS